MKPWVFQRGETIAVPLAARGASESQAQAMEVTANLKRTRFMDRPDAAEPVAAIFSPMFSDDVDGSPGWVLTIDAATSEDLAPGRYGVNASITFADGSVVKTVFLPVQIEAAT
jgi:hypothetical protein